MDLLLVTLKKIFKALNLKQIIYHITEYINKTSNEPYIVSIPKESKHFVNVDQSIGCIIFFLQV